MPHSLTSLCSSHSLFIVINNIKPGIYPVLMRHMLLCWAKLIKHHFLKKDLASDFKELMSKHGNKVTPSVMPSLILPGRLTHTLLHSLKTWHMLIWQLNTISSDIFFSFTADETLLKRNIFLIYTTSMSNTPTLDYLLFLNLLLFLLLQGICMCYFLCLEC